MSMRRGKTEIFTKSLSLVEPVSCPCGKEHTETGPMAKVTEVGAWFNCECKSTLLAPVEASGLKLPLSHHVTCVCGKVHYTTGTYFSIDTHGVWFRCDCTEMLYLARK